MDAFPICCVGQIFRHAMPPSLHCLMRISGQGSAFSVWRQGGIDGDQIAVCGSRMGWRYSGEGWASAAFWDVGYGKIANMAQSIALRGKRAKKNPAEAGLGSLGEDA